MKIHIINLLLAFYCLNNISFSQDIKKSDPVNKNNVNSYDSKYLLQEELKLQINTPKNKDVEKIENIGLYRYSIDMLQNRGTIKEERNFNIISSFRENIRFGGFWERYAIVNFTPDMFIKPFDFMSIYAVHNSSYLIPVKAVKEHIKLMVIQSAAILIIDNTVKHLLPFSKIIKAITGFAFKNVVINSLLKQIKNKGSDRIIEQDNFYCALSIRF